MTPWVQRLLVANVVMFLLTSRNPALSAALTFVPLRVHLTPWTLVTYMFLHANLTHLLFNMVGLFFFGPRLEERLGGRNFILMYLCAGLGGALLSFVFSPRAGVVGASAAVFGVLLGFARYWPKEDIYIWAVLPIQARMLALFLVISSLYAGFPAQLTASRTSRTWGTGIRLALPEGVGAATEGRAARRTPQFPLPCSGRSGYRGP